MSPWLTGQKPSVLWCSQGRTCFTGHRYRPVLPRMTSDIVILRRMTHVATKTVLPVSLATENSLLGSTQSWGGAGLACSVPEQGPYGPV